MEMTRKPTVLKIAWEDFHGLNPINEPKTSLQIMLRPSIYDGLVTRNAEGEIQPALAESWRIVDDLTWEFSLRQGVRFHNGQPFDSEAVSYAFQRMLASKLAYLWNAVEKVEILSKYSIRLKTRYPYAPLLANLSMAAMVPPDVDNLDEHPVGTGPFKFVSYKRGELFLLESNREYWQGRPDIDEVYYFPCNDEAERAQKIIDHEVDITFQVPAESLPTISDTPGLEVKKVKGPDTPVLSLNGFHPPFNDGRVRRAISLGIDRRSLVEDVLGGIGIVARSVLSPFVFGHDPTLPELTQNKDEARRLLADGGFSEGIHAVVTVPGNAIPRGLEVCKAIKDQLSDLGITLEVEQLSEDKAWPKFSSRDFDIFLNGWSELTLDADYNLNANYHSVSREGCQDRELDDLIDYGRRVLDKDQRLQVYKEIQNKILGAPYRVPLYHAMDVWVIHHNVKGFKPYVNRVIDLRKVSKV